MELIFNDSPDRSPWQIPATSELTDSSRDQLRENAVLLSYAIQHGSGANVKLSFPFCYTIAHMLAADRGQDVDPVNLVREIEEEGRNANLGTITVKV